MLIELDPSLASVPVGKHSVSAGGLNRIGKAYLDGCHVVTGPVNLLSKLGGREDLAHMAKRGYTKAQADRSENERLKSIVYASLLVKEGNSNATYNRIGGRKVIEVGIEHFYNNAFSNPSTLLCESHNDNLLFKQIGRYFAYTNSAPGLRIRTRDDYGGGGNTAHTYSNRQGKGELVLCIVDSDRLAPSHRLGSTARSVSRRDEESKPMARLEILPVREAENMLPSELAFDALSNSQASKVQRLKKIGEVSCDARNHLNIKDGWTLEDVLTRDNTSVKSFWTGLAEALLKNKPRSRHSECIRYNECRSDQSCSCEIFEGLGKETLSQCASKARKYGRAQLSRVCDDCTEGPWTQVGKAIMTWCCGTESSVM